MTQEYIMFGTGKLRTSPEGDLYTTGENAGSSTMTKVQVNFTRPSNTDAYAAKDVVGNTGTAAVITFADLGAQGFIIGARVMTSQKTCVAGLRLHLYSVAPTAIADNSPFLLLYANRANKLCTIDFPTLSTEDATNSTGAIAEVYDRPLPYVAATDTIYGVLETRDAFTPDSAQTFFIELTASVF